MKRGEKLENDIIIAKAVLDHLNTWDEKPCKFGMDALEKSPLALSLSMQQLSGTVIQKRYIDGSFIGAWPFAVYVRIAARDTAIKLDAVKTLEQIDEWIQRADHPNLGGRREVIRIAMASLPSVAARYEDGSIDYQAVFQLTYKQMAM